MRTNEIINIFQNRHSRIQMLFTSENLLKNLILY